MDENMYGMLLCHVIKRQSCVVNTMKHNRERIVFFCKFRTIKKYEEEKINEGNKNLSSNS